MVLTQDNRSLIEQMVRGNRRFPGNEDLFDDFCNEAIEHSLFIFEKTVDVTKISNYLNKIVSTAIIKVLKNAGRITRTSDGYKNAMQYVSPLENPLDNGFIDIKDMSVNFVEELIEQETLQEIYDTIIQLDKKYPAQKFGLIFYMKYVESKRQKDIAKVLDISQGEVSKRLVDLMQKVNHELK